MDENVRTVISPDKAVAPGIYEPLHLALHLHTYCSQRYARAASKQVPTGISQTIASSVVPFSLARADACECSRMNGHHTRKCPLRPVYRTIPGTCSGTLCVRRSRSSLR